MRQKDYLVTQAEMLGRALGKVLADLLGSKSEGHVMEATDLSDRTLKEELGIDLNEICEIPNEELVATLMKNEKLNGDNLERLAHILFAVGDIYENLEQEKMRKFYERALVLFNYVNVNSSTFSIDRLRKMEKIQTILDR